MARDYVRYQPRGSQRRSGFGILWLIAGLLAALFIGGLFYLKQQSDETAHKRTHHTAAVKTDAQDHIGKKAKEPTTNTAAEKPEFDFYTLLPQAQVEVPKQAPAVKKPPVMPAAPAPTTTPANTPAPRPATASVNYMLQIAAVRDAGEAERLKAELTLLGFSPAVTRVTVNRVVWNRITLGPYNSEQLAQADQKRLKENQINSLMMKVK